MSSIPGRFSGELMKSFGRCRLQVLVEKYGMDIKPQSIISYSSTVGKLIITIYIYYYIIILFSFY